MSDPQVNAVYSDGHTPVEVCALAKTVLSGRRFVIVSNREPYEHVRTGNKVSVRKTVGGLVAALEPVIEAVGGTWIAWGSGSADKEVVDARDGIALPPGSDAYRLRRVWLNQDEVRDFYEGHVNQTLWPLCHSLTENVRFLRPEWDVYQSVNRRFAETVTEELPGDGVVWFQDYHFATAPSMLRHLRPDLTIMQFWHIPWPPWEIFRQHPQRRALLEGLLGCDLIGMHIELFCVNFLECVQRELRLPVDFGKQQVVVGNRTVRVRTLPISVDARQLDELARTDAVKKRIADFRKAYPLAGASIGVGVERADYTKGLVLRLKALNLLFSQYPEWRGKFSFVQVLPPSRDTIPAYSHYRQRVGKMIDDLNAQYGTKEWQPVIYIRSAQSTLDVIALFRLADVAVVSSRQDGMNLVAKEFIAARSDERGVLVLSEFAGASEEMHQALAINPYDLEGFAYAMHTALQMPAESQASHMRQLRLQLFGNTVYDWIADILYEIDMLSPNAPAGPLPLLDHLEEVHHRIASVPKLEVFCDYDGVLSPIAARPKEARMDEHVRDLLIKLRDSENVHVSIISGRALDDVQELVSVERLTYAGNHGLQIRGPRVEHIHPAADRVHALLRRLYEDMRENMRPFPGALVEDKQLGLSVHYRLVSSEQVPEVANMFYKLVNRNNHDRSLRVTTGKSVLEVRPNVQWDKGRAVLWILRALHGERWMQTRI
ncbi:MAG TPA: trehalose-phosphatase, partial [Candidatus Peribacteria bacterium]|nr:trehalose-phosphatase [Candidatus Peribacteria bacterium]